MNTGSVKRNTAHRMRDEALLSYHALKQGNLAEALAYVRRAEGAVKAVDASASVELTVPVDAVAPLEAAYFLWILGEYVNHGGDRSEVESRGVCVDGLIAHIGLHWQAPQHHWLWVDEHGVFLGNMAVYFGALQAINNARRSPDAQMLAKRIRETVFSAFMKGNHFISSQDGEAVWGDITAVAAPFKLLSLGDLALIGAIGQLRKSELDTDSAALLAWYYKEAGQLGPAKSLLDQISATESDGVLPLIAAEQIQLALIARDAGSGRDAAVTFDHDPLGGESPYFAGNNERAPRHPTAGDAVVIRTFAAPDDGGLAVYLEYAVDAGAVSKLPMTRKQSPDGELFWEAELPAVADATRGQYSFSAAYEGRVFHSATYAYAILRWTDVDAVLDVMRDANEIQLIMDARDREGRPLRLTVRSEPDGVARCLLDFAESGGVGGGVSTGVSAGTPESAQEEALTSTLTGEPERAPKPAAGLYAVGNIEIAIRQSGKAAIRLSDSSAAGEEAGVIPFIQALVAPEGTVHKVRLNYRTCDNEAFFGMGERFSDIAFSGCELDNYVFNQYKDQGTRTYMPSPFAFSANGYGLFLDSPLYSVFRFGTVRADVLQIEADVHQEKQTLQWYHYSGKPLDMIEQHTLRTGKPKLPPKWAFGPWMSSNNWDSEREVDKQLAQSAVHRIPSTVMVLEQWSDESTFYIFNDASYEEKQGGDRFAYDDFQFPGWGRWPDPKALVRRIHDQGLKVLFWQAPVMKYMDGIAHAQRDEDERYMLDRGFAVKKADGSPYRIPQYEWFRGSLVPDFTNPEAADWWFAKRRYMLEELGIDGFKTDGGECIYGSDTMFHDGRNGAEMRNEYPNVYVAAFHRFANMYRENAITFSRAGYTGAQNMPLHWAGDEKSTFSAFRSSIVAGLSCGMSGIPFWGWDLGGFSGEIPTAELYIRSAQMAAFCPVMQYHAESKGEFNLDRTPWNIAERTGQTQVLDEYKKYADIRMNLLPYIYEQARLSSLTGRPLMQAMAIAYPEDLQCRSLTTQYMFGEALLVAPVTEEGAAGRDVYLPGGEWLPLFGGERLAGGRTIAVAADLSEIPVFMKADTAIPLNLGAGIGLSDDVGNRTDGYERLSMMLFVVSHVAQRFADDLGNSVALNASRIGGTIEASVEIAGDYQVTLIVRDCRSPGAVAVGTEKLARTGDPASLDEGGYWLARNDDVCVRLAPGVHELKITL